jgi:hypothetical protein
VRAVFLVSEADGWVHDIFRQYRTSFEARGSGFANLVILGQHGVSTTVRLLLAEWGLSGEALPALALLAEEGQDAGFVLDLPAGAAPEVHPTDPQPWQEVLGRIEGAAEAPGSKLDLANVPGIQPLPKSEESLDQLVRRALQSLRPDAGAGP